MNLLDSSKEQLIQFSKSKKHIYIYGAGKYGRVCCKLLHEFDIKVEAFLVTEISQIYVYEDIPVYSAKEILPRLNSDDGVIFALKQSFRLSILRSIFDNVLCSFFELPDYVWYYLKNWRLFNEITRLAKLYPCTPFPKCRNLSNILVVRIDLIGDMVLTTAFLRELRKNFPKAEITLIMNQDICSLLQKFPYIDRILPYPFSRHEMENRDIEKIKKKVNEFIGNNLSNHNYDAIFLPREQDNPVENILLAAYSGIKTRIGGIDLRYGNLTDLIFGDVVSSLFSVFHKNFVINKHVVDAILDMLRSCGCDIKDDRTELFVNESEREYAKNVLRYDSNRKTVFIAVGLVGSSPARSWPAELYSELINRLYKKYGDQIKFVLCGGKDALKSTHIIGNHPACINTVNKTNLSQVIAIIEQCDFYMGADTGLMHIASAVGKPVIEIAIQLSHGSAASFCSVERTGPWKVPYIAIRPKHGVDEECEMHGHCVKSYPHCINQITVDEMESAVMKMFDTMRK